MLGAGTGLKENVLFWASLGSIVCIHTARNQSIPSREGLTQESSYKFEGLNVSISREARIGRSGDSDCERRVAPLLATSGVGCTVKVCREMRRARRQRRAQAEPQPYYLPIVLREDGN